MIWQVPVQEVVDLLMFSWNLFVVSLVMMFAAQFVVWLPAIISDIGFISREEAKGYMRRLFWPCLAPSAAGFLGCLLLPFSLRLVMLHPELGEISLTF